MSTEVKHSLQNFYRSKDAHVLETTLGIKLVRVIAIIYQVSVNN